MERLSTAAQVEADLAALRRAAERAGTALACLFSSADEYEAELIRERRAAGAFAHLPQPRQRSSVLKLIVIALLAATLLVF